MIATHGWQNWVSVGRFNCSVFALRKVLGPLSDAEGLRETWLAEKSSLERANAFTC
jgi:hypothetical protein